MKMTCFHHGDMCLDGIVSAWAVSQSAKFGHHSKTRYYPVTYNNPPPCHPGGFLILVDFIYPDIDVMRSLIDTAHRTIVLDHHPVAEHLIKQLSQEYSSEKFQGFFDSQRSGAGLTWDTLVNKPRPALVDHVEDRDLWRFSLPNTEDFCNGLRQYALTFKNLAYCADPDNYTEVLQRGKQYAAEIDACWERNVRYMDDNYPDVPRLSISDRAVPLLLIDTPNLRSELAARFLDRIKEPVVGLIWKVGEHTRMRLVSTPDGPDVNLMANGFGGGGHQHSAGLMLDCSIDELLN